MIYDMLILIISQLFCLIRDYFFLQHNFHYELFESILWNRYICLIALNSRACTENRENCGRFSRVAFRRSAPSARKMHRYICLAIAAKETRRTILLSLSRAHVFLHSILLALFLLSSRALAARSWPTTTLSCERANFARKSTRPKERIRGPPRSRSDSGDPRPWVHEGGRDVKKEGRREGDRSRWWRWT